MIEPRTQSLTMIVGVSDADACAVELARQRVALERGWAALPGVRSACLALLPPLSDSGSADAALLFECSFEGTLPALSTALFQALGTHLNAVLRLCDGYPAATDARALADYLSARAQRATAFRDVQEPSAVALRGWHALRAWLDSVAQRWSRRTAPVAMSPTEAQLEERRVAVGMQEPEPGVPLLHVARLLPDAPVRGRLRRALQEVERQASPHVRGLRFLVHHERLLFLAYPSENAPRWSERVSHVALATLTRVWGNTAEFSRSLRGRRAARERRLQHFMLEHRVPVAAWFNAQA